MRPKSLILLTLALGCGLVASIGINQVMANRRVQNPSAGAELTPIFVAAKDIALGDPLVVEMVKLDEWPKDKVPPGAITKLEQLEGRRSRHKIYSGEPVLEAKLFAKGESGGFPSDRIPPGFRAISVKVDQSSGSGLILPSISVRTLATALGPQARRLSYRTSKCSPLTKSSRKRTRKKRA
jgi:pilus assembly protein CpaB